MSAPPTVDSPDAFATLRTHLAACDSGVRHRGQDYHRRGQVLSVTRVDARTLRGEVRGTKLYTAELLRAGRGWRNTCSCPLTGDCKHVVALALQWLQQLGIASGAPPAVGSPAKSSAPEPLRIVSRQQLEAILVETLGHPLSAQEGAFLGKLAQIFHNFRQSGRVAAHDLKRLGFADGATQLDVAAELTAGCREMYKRNPLGMGPEIGHFNVDDEHAADDMLIKPADAHSLLRPEYVESLYVLWRVTGEQRYRDWGWDVWRGIERYARVDTGGYASIESVLEDPPRQRDHMESFFVAETLKYLHLLFEDDAAVLPLDAWVLNTEAHPLPVLRGGG